eukprot:TRINITY_DN8137_c0_g3_i1.p1 TRINITY_DN8137_c0_g3~~TRINITY_DN8137_c0_g3_i1.p1  ORF type:complete len:642 (+),score=112.15 TRINITY_DN8137_c0_g3_i1:1526-3451(+)
MYSGVARLQSLTEEQVTLILVHADRFNLPQLKRICEVVIFQMFCTSKRSVQELCDILTFTHKYRVTRLRDLILNSSVSLALSEAIEHNHISLRSFLEEYSYRAHDSWGLEAMMFVIYNLYRQNRRDRKAVIDYYNQSQNAAGVAGRDRPSIDFEQFVVSKEDFSVMERPYFILFGMNILCSIFYLISSLLILRKIEYLGSHVMPSWKTLFSIPILSMFLSTFGRFAHFQHRNKFRLQWWKKRQASKMQSHLNGKLERVEHMKHLLGTLAKLSHSFDNREGTAATLLNEESKTWRSISPVGLRQRSKSPVHEAGSASPSVDDSHSETSEGDMNVGESFLRLDLFEKSLQKEQVQIARDLTEVKSSGNESELRVSTKQDIWALLFSISGRFAGAVFLLVLALYLDGSVRNVSGWIKSWIPLLTYDIAATVVGCKSGLDVWKKSWRRILQNHNLTRCGRWWNGFSVSVNIILNLLFSPAGIFVVQNVLLLVGICLQTRGTTTNWFLIFLPLLIFTGFFAGVFVLVDAFTFFVSLLSLVAMPVRRHFSRLIRDFLSRNPHVSFKLVASTVIILHMMSFSALATMMSLCTRLNSLKNSGMDVVLKQMYLLTVPLITFHVSLVFSTLCMFKLRRYAWDNFYHVWRQT